MKRLISVIAVAGLIAAGVIRAFADPVPIEQLQRLQKGMTKDEVRKVLGNPAKIYQSGQWTYQRLFVFGFVNIHWQADGTYDGDYNYERF